MSEALVPIPLAPEPDYLPDSRSEKVDDATVFAGIHGHKGNLSKLGDELGVSRRWLFNRIERTPALAAAYEDYIERVKDQAQENVFSGVEKNDATDSRFVLQTLGKDRGFSQGVAGTGKGGEIIVQINRLSDG